MSKHEKALTFDNNNTSHVSYLIFDPQIVSDRSTYQHPMETTVGVEYLLVGGVKLVDKGKLIEGVYPGKAVLGEIKRQ